MQFTNASKTELALIIQGLRAIYVADSEKARQNLLEKAETALSSKYGLKVPEDA